MGGVIIETHGNTVYKVKAEFVHMQLFDRLS